MKPLLDTNVVLDLLLERTPFVDDAAEIFAWIETGKAVGYLCGTTLTTIHYIATKAIGAASSRKQIAKLLKLFEVAPVGRPVLEDALALRFGDFEDAVIHEAARHAGATAIVTRNGEDFKGGTLPIYSPQQMAKILAAAPLRH